MLIVNAGRDYQVTTCDFENWKSGLAGIEKVRFESYPALNHLLIAGKGLSHPGEYQLPGKVDEKVINDISEWIHSQG